MDYNIGAEIVPVDDLSDFLGTQPDLPDNYERVQLCTKESYAALLLTAWGGKHGSIVYGSLSPDWPLCEDFSGFCLSRCKEEAHRAGTACRPGIFRCDYTKNSGNRHSIVSALTAKDHVKLYYEPQSDAWLSQPEDAKSIDSYVII